MHECVWPILKTLQKTHYAYIFKTFTWYFHLCAILHIYLQIYQTTIPVCMFCTVSEICNKFSDYCSNLQTIDGQLVMHFGIITHCLMFVPKNIIFCVKSSTIPKEQND